MNPLACVTSGMLLFASDVSIAGGDEIDLVKLFKILSFPAIVVLLGFLLMVLVIRLLIRHTIANAFEEQKKTFAILFKRRSDFEDRVIAARFTLVTELTSRLERVGTNLNRIYNGEEPDTGFMRGNDVVPLTAIFEDLQVHRLVLTEELHQLLHRRAEIALELSKTREKEARRKLTDEWDSNHKKLRVLVGDMFKLDLIKVVPV
jgi:hypothetical protein